MFPPRDVSVANVAQIVERTLESSEAQGVELINTIVGLDPSNQALHELVGQQSSRIQVLEERNATL